MKDKRNITIIVLAVTATVLLAMLIGFSNDNASYASTSVSNYAGTLISRSDYIMISGAVLEGKELLYMIDIGARKMVLYDAKGSTPNRTIELPAVVDLEKEFAAD
jgi:hypothetical protein